MKFMTPVTLFVIVAVLAMGAALVTKNAVKNRPSTSTQVAASTPPVANLKTVQADLTLQPETTAISVGETTAYQVTVDTRNLGLSGVQTEFTFDPAVLTIISITPGPFLQNPVVLAKTIDPSSGKITYALASLKYSTGKGILFTIQVKAKTAAAGRNPLSFVRENTKVGLADQVKDKRFSEAETVVVFQETPLTVSLK